MGIGHFETWYCPAPVWAVGIFLHVAKSLHDEGSLGVSKQIEITMVSKLNFVNNIEVFVLSKLLLLSPDKQRVIPLAA